MRQKSILSILMIILLTALSYASESKRLIIAKPFGISVKDPDPAKGYNGWHTNESGVTETLFVLNFNMNIEPWLAKSFKNINPLVWQIKLRKGIKFHDNTPMNALSVKWSIERVINEKSSVFNKRIHGLLNIRSIHTKNNYTLIFKTNEPNAAFIYDLTSSGTGIIGYSSKKGKIIGTGPFILKEVVPNEQIIVTRFDKYWRGKPNLAEAHLKIIRNPTTRMLAFEAGQVDLALDFPENDAKRIKSRKNTNIIHKPTNRLCFLFLRVADGPLADPYIRKAINYAIDRQEIVDMVLAGIGGEVSASIFPKFFPWNNRSLWPYPYDPVKASKLLLKAGAIDSNGDGILEIGSKPLILNAWTYEGRPSLKPTLELLQVQLARVGIGLKLKVTQKGSPINLAMKKGKVHLNLQMWNTAPQGDPDYFISNIFTRDAVSNFMGYYNSELEVLARKGKETFNQKKRKKIYNRIQKIIFDESPIIVLFHKSMVSAVYDYVKNYRVHPAEIYLLTPKLFNIKKNY